MAKLSPFPGMDPWLERLWRSVHNTFIQYCSDQISGLLPDGLYAGAEQTVYVVSTSQVFIPDSAVFHAQRTDSVGSDVSDREEQGAVAVTAEPVRIRRPRMNVSHRHIAIRDHANGDALVTAIEVFSPTNKIDPAGRRKYLRKRSAYYDAGVNLVEIDLLRAGRHLIDLPLDDLADGLRTPYKACVHFGDGLAEGSIEEEVDYYPMPLRQRLPRIRVPLRPTDRDVVLDLQQPLDDAYDRGRFWMRIDYTKPPDPPLAPEDATWAAELIRRWKAA